MKTTILKYITVTFAAGAMLLAGCNDLDQEPTNKFTDKAFWTSPERANMVLNMAYNQMFGHDKIWAGRSPERQLVRTARQSRYAHDPHGAGDAQHGTVPQRVEMGVRGCQDLQCLYEFRGRGAGHGPRTARRDEGADPLYPCVPLFPSGQFLRRHSLLPAGYFARRVAPRLPHSLSGGDECAAPRTRRRSSATCPPATN